MPTVTSLKSQKNGKRVNVYLDDEFSFGIDLDSLVLLKIKVGSNYSEEEVNELIKKAQYQKTLEKVLKFAALRPRSEKEITNYLKKKEIHESLYEKLIMKLKYYELLDDVKFAKWWVNQRVLQKKSIKGMIFELRSKGIKQEIIDDVLENTEIDEEKTAKELIEKKMYKWEKLEPRLKKQKISQFLAQKGFGWDVIRKVTKFD